MKRNLILDTGIKNAQDAAETARKMILDVIPIGTVGWCLHRHGQINRSRCKVDWATSTGYLEVLLLDCSGGRTGRRGRQVHYTNFFTTETGP